MEQLLCRQTNTIYERYKFNNRSQEPGETIDAYATAVRTLADTCSFGNLKEEMIRDRLVCGISDNALRKKLLQESQLTLEKCMDYCRAAEAANSQLKEISSHGPDTVNYLSKSKKGKPQSQPQLQAQPKLGRNTGSPATKQMIMRDCKYCGRRHERKKEKCPAFGKTCNKCGGKDHFSNVCQQQIQPGNKAPSRNNLQQSKLRVHELHEDAQTSSEDEVWALSFAEEVNTVTDNKKRIYAAMEIGKKTVEIQIGTGASCNVLPCSFLPANTEIQTTKRERTSYSKSKLSVLGTAGIRIRNPCNNTEYAVEFVIVEDGFAPLLGAETAQKMNLLVVQHQNILQPDYQTPEIIEDSINSLTEEQVLAEYADLFKGLGKIEGKLHLEFDETVTPVVMPPRRVPVAVKGKLREELDRLESLGVLEKVHGCNSKA